MKEKGDEIRVSNVWQDGHSAPPGGGIIGISDLSFAHKAGSTSDFSEVIVEVDMNARKAAGSNGSFGAAGTVPPVEPGEMETFIIAVRRADGIVSTFPADYLNEFPLWCDEADPDRNNATGWFEAIPDETRGAIVSPVFLRPGDEVIAWSTIPQYKNDGWELRKFG